MREKNWFIFAIVFSLVHSGMAFADCREDADPVVSKALVDQTNDITDQVGDKLTDNQIKLLGERVKDLQSGANVLSLKAADAKADLSTQVECGDGVKISKAQCIQKQIDFDKGRMDIMSDEAKTKTQTEVDELQAQLDKPTAISEASSNYAQASSVLREMIKTNDFSWKEHFGIIGKALLTSWKALITPGPIIVLSAGAAGAGASYASGLDQTDKEWALHAGPAPAISKVTDQIGYAYPVLAPFLIVAAITKDNQTMKTFDALTVGTAISQAINEATKYGAGRERPNGSDNLSFFSGHATQSFMMATVLDHEYPGHHHIVGISSVRWRGPCFFLSGSRRNALSE